MEIAHFIVKGSNCFLSIVARLDSELQQCHKSEIINGYIFYIENFSLANSSDLMTAVRIQKRNNSDAECEIEVVAGGGGNGLLSLTWGNEKRRLNKVIDIIEVFCNFKKFELSEIVIKG